MTSCLSSTRSEPTELTPQSPRGRAKVIIQRNKGKGFFGKCRGPWMTQNHYYLCNLNIKPMNKLLSRSDDSQFPFWILTISIFIISVLPSLIQDGMFIDGVQYAAVSKNWANGLGTFWVPYLSQNWYQNFHAMGSNVFLENPPLVYAIQGLFFKIF